MKYLIQNDIRLPDGTAIPAGKTVGKDDIPARDIKWLVNQGHITPIADESEVHVVGTDVVIDITPDGDDDEIADEEQV